MDNINIRSLVELRARVNEKVIGQLALVDAVTSTIYRHFIKIMGYTNQDLPPSTTSLLIAGDTGTGKTFAVEKTLEELGLCFIKIDGKRIAPDGFDGIKFLALLEEGFKAVHCESYRQYPVVFIDEIDKAVIPHCGTTISNYHELVQSSLLRYLDGATVTLNTVTCNTKNFCFIFAGAFAGLFDTEKLNIGFTADEPAELKLQEKIMSYGMIPELAGRISKYVKTNDFSREMYRDLVCNKDFVFNKWVTFMGTLNIKGESPNYSLLVEEAFKLKMGARGMIQLLDSYIDALAEQVDVRELYTQTTQSRRL